MEKLMLGTEVAKAMKEALTLKTERLKEQGIVPCLAIVRVGERPDDISYERGAKKKMEGIGIECRICGIQCGSLCEPAIYEWIYHHNNQWERETIRDVDTCSYQYTGNASIAMDENGNFIFTLTDGSKMKMNVGKVESTVSIPASASIGENSLDEMQMRLDKLEKQAEKKAARDKLVYVALALSVLSLLWNATTLITELMKKKREEEK